jgi:hypothetical protein
MTQIRIKDVYNLENKNTDINFILNKHFNEATKFYHNLRIVKSNGKDIIVTLDYCKTRCNIEVLNGIIIRIVGFY